MQPYVQYPSSLSHVELLHVSHLFSQLKPEVPKIHYVRKTQMHNVPQKKIVLISCLVWE